MPSVLLEMDFHFAAAHELPASKGPCFSMHGHNYRLTVSVGGQGEGESGMPAEFHEVAVVVQREVLDVLDHTSLNDTIRHPSAANVARWVWERIEPHLPGLAAVRVWETKDTSVVYRGAGR